MKNISVIMGGTSSEREVSLQTGKAVSDALKNLNYNVKDIILNTEDKDEIAKLLTPKPDCIFNALHGTFGEDGQIQKIFNELKIPYTHSNVESSKTCMSKPKTIEVYKKHNIPVAEHCIFDEGEISPEKIPFAPPYVIKPAEGGSSCGLYIVHKNSDFPDLKDWKLGKIMVEKYVKGREFTVAVLGNKDKLVALNVTELKPKSGVYDYAAKYSSGLTEHICPANIEPELKEKLISIAILAHQKLGCNAISRTDFRYDDETNTIATLETNTQPGMTNFSLVPEQAYSNNITMEKLVNQIIENANNTYD